MTRNAEVREGKLAEDGQQHQGVNLLYEMMWRVGVALVFVAT